MPERIRVPDGMSEPERNGDIVTSRVSLPTDEDGFFGRECPRQDCLAYFKLHADEYEAAKASGVLTCPVCGVEAPQDDFMTQDQLARARAAALELAQGAVNAMLRDAFSGLGSARRGPVTISYRPAPSRMPRPLPTYEERATVRTFTCPGAGHRAVLYDRLVACPYCGAATPPRALLDDGLVVQERLLAALEHLPDGERAEVEALGGVPAMSERSLTGAVASFQAFAKDLHVASGKPVTVRNPWQSPTRLAEQWAASFRRDPLAALTGEAASAVRLGFARRHILEHNGGRADEKYLRESGDTIAPGRPVRYGPGFVREFIAALRLFADALETTGN